MFHIGDPITGLGTDVLNEMQFVYDASQNDAIAIAGSGTPTFFSLAQNGPMAAIYGLNWMDANSDNALQNIGIFAETFNVGYGTGYPASGVYAMVNVHSGASITNFNPSEGGYLTGFRSETHVYDTSIVDANIGYVSQVNFDDPTATVGRMIGFHSVAFLGTNASSGSLTLPLLAHFLAESPVVPDSDGVLATITDAHGLHVKPQTSNNSGVTVTNPVGVYIEDQGTGHAILAEGGMTELRGGLQAPLTTPASSTAAGKAGQIQWDADYVYVCVADNTWKRSALTTF